MRLFTSTDHNHASNERKLPTLSNTSRSITPSKLKAQTNRSSPANTGIGSFQQANRQHAYQVYTNQIQQNLKLQKQEGPSSSPPSSSFGRHGSFPNRRDLNSRRDQKNHILETSTIGNSNYKEIVKPNGVNDIVLKRALADAFDSTEGSYLAYLQDSVTKYTHNPNTHARSIPKTMIPEEYFVYSKSPIMAHSGSNEDNDGSPVFDSKTNEWRKLMFPSYSPATRSEVYLLAKTMDKMIAQMNAEQNDIKDEDSFKDITLIRLAKSFKIHVTALFEISRQAFVTCVERGVLLQKLYKYFCDFFEACLSVIRSEREKCEDFQTIINEYEALMKDLAIEKEKTRQEMEDLMRENGLLFKEKEEFRQKVVNTPKYDLVIKILKNKKTWETFLKETNSKSEKQDLSLASMISDMDQSQESVRGKKSKKARKFVRLNAMSTSIGHSSRYDEIEDALGDQDEYDGRSYNRVSPSNFLMTTNMKKPGLEDVHTQRMLKLIWTNMSDTFAAVSNISKNASQVLDKPLVTEMDNERFVASMPDLQTLLAGIYEINARLNEVNTIYKEQAERIAREKLEPKPILVKLIPNNRLNTIQVLLRANQT